MSISLRKSSSSDLLPTTPTTRVRSATGRHAKSKRSNKEVLVSNESIPESIAIKQDTPANYCVNIHVDGQMNMDRASHISSQQLNASCLEHSLRPISGVRNHLRRNLSHSQSRRGFDAIKDTDFIDRIGNLLNLN